MRFLKGSSTLYTRFTFFGVRVSVIRAILVVRGHLEAFQNTLNVSGGGILSKSDK